MKNNDDSVNNVKNNENNRCLYFIAKKEIREI